MTTKAKVEILKKENATGDHEGQVQIMTMEHIHAVYENHKNGTNYPVPEYWVDAESRAGKEWIEREKKIRARLKQ